MTFEELPDQVQTMLVEKHEQEMRAQFMEFEHEVMDAFLSQADIEKMWLEFREDCFQQEFREGENCDFIEWLGIQGIDGAPRGA